MRKAFLISVLCGATLAFASGEDEPAAAVGPDQGILEKGELGFRLSPEALRTIDFKTVTFTAPGAPCSAIVDVKDRKFIFRSKNGWLKSLAIEVFSRNGATCSIRGEGLASGDSIVTTQTGFLRIVDILLAEGASHSH